MTKVKKNIVLGVKDLITALYMPSYLWQNTLW